MLLGGAWCRLLGISLLADENSSAVLTIDTPGKTAWVVPTLPDESRIALWAGAISSAKTMKLMSLMSHWTMQFLGSNNTIVALLLFHFRFSFLRCPDRSNALLQHCGCPVMPFGQPLVHKRNDLTWYATAWMPGLNLYVNMSRLSWWWS